MDSCRVDGGHREAMDQASPLLGMLEDLGADVVSFQFNARLLFAIRQEDWINAPDDAAVLRLRDYVAGRLFCDGNVYVVFGEGIDQPPSSDRSVVQRLTQRELKVACLIAEGLTDKMIARQLGISAHTVREHCRRACAKLGISKRSALVRHLCAGHAPSITARA